MRAVRLKLWVTWTALAGGGGLGRMALVAAALLGACTSRGGLVVSGDAGQPRDLGRPLADFSAADDLASPPVDLGATDLAGRDLAALPDFTVAHDFAMPLPDLALPPDLVTTRPPCKRGTGWAAWRFRYAGSSSARIDAFGLPDSSNWDVGPAYSTSYTDDLHGGGLEIGSGNWILIRFSLVGLSHINSATLSVYGRSYNTGSSGSFDAWSPIYGSISSPTDSVSNAWPYAWTSVDYTANVQIGDPPGLTGIRLSAGPSSDDLIMNTVELCIDGD